MLKSAESAKKTTILQFSLNCFPDQVMLLPVPGVRGAVRRGDGDNDGGAHEQAADAQGVRLPGAIVPPFHLWQSFVSIRNACHNCRPPPAPAPASPPQARPQPPTRTWPPRPLPRRRPRPPRPSTTTLSSPAPATAPRCTASSTGASARFSESRSWAYSCAYSRACWHTSC